MARQCTQLVDALRALASASAADDYKRRTWEVNLNLDALQNLHMIKKQYDDLRAGGESEDEDVPGAPLAHSNTEPLHTMQKDQVSKPSREFSSSLSNIHNLQGWLQCGA